MNNLKQDVVFKQNCPGLGDSLQFSTLPERNILTGKLKMKTMKTIKRNICISCEGALEEKHCIRDFPIYMGTTIEPKEDDRKADLIFAECVSCGCIQLNNLIPLEILYKKNHAGSVGSTWLAHHKKFADFVLKYATGNVVEIGGAHLTLANLIESNEAIESVTVYDANIIGNPISDKVKTVEGLFDSKTVSQKPNAIVHSHVIEHLYEPMKEIKEMAKLLEDGGTMVISAPIINKMMEDGFTNAMNFEHTYGLTKELLHRILTNAGLRILEEYNFSDYCVFVSAIKDSLISSSDCLEQDNSYFTKFINIQNSEVRRINHLLEGENPEQTFIFGAHIFTQFLVKNGVSERLFCCVLDNDVKKQDNRLYGTGLFVKSPEVLRRVDSPIVVLKAGQYTEEIMTGIINNINPNTRFIL